MSGGNLGGTRRLAGSKVTVRTGNGHAQAPSHPWRQDRDAPQRGLTYRPITQRPSKYRR